MTDWPPALIEACLRAFDRELDGDPFAAVLDAAVEWRDETGTPALVPWSEFDRMVDQVRSWRECAETAEAERDRWMETARLNQQNVDYWRERAETAEARVTELSAALDP